MVIASAQRLSLWDNWGDEWGCDESHWHTHTRGLSWGLPEVVGRVQLVHCNRGRLLRRGLEFYVCTINKSVHTKKVWKHLLILIAFTFYNKSCISLIFSLLTLVWFLCLMVYQTSQFLTIRKILEAVRAKNLQATLLFVDFTNAFNFIHRGKMEQILLVYGLSKQTLAAITILNKNTKVKVCSPDRDTEYFDIVAGVLQGDTLAPYLFTICLDYVLRTSIDKIRENGFELTKKRSWRYPAKTITDADYADDITILASTPNQVETLLYNLEGAAAGIGLHVNAHKQVTSPH